MERTELSLTSRDHYSNSSYTSSGEIAVVSLLPSAADGQHLSSKENKDEEGKKELFPIDRGWAWVIVGACFGMHVLVVGSIKSFGVLFVEFRDKYHVNARDLGVVQGIVMTMMLGLGLGANLLAVQFTSQKVVFAGGLLAALGFVLSAFIPSFEFLYLTYSVITGLGFALSYSPCVVMVGLHFKKRRSLANGISVSGSGVGSFILPNAMRWMLNEYGLTGCLLLLGGLMLNVCVFAMLLRPTSSYVSDKTQQEECQKCVNDEDTDLQQLMEITKKEIVSGTYDSNSRIKDTSEDGHEKTAERYQETSGDFHKTEFVHNGDLFMTSLQSIPHEEMQSMSARLCARIKCSNYRNKTKSPGGRRGAKLFNWSLLSNPLFLIYASSCALANFAYPNIFLMLPAFAESNGQDRDSAALLLSVVGIADLAGRLFFGWFSDLKCLPKRFGFIGGLAISGILCLVAPVMTSFTLMAVYAGIYGFFAGSFFALISVMLAEALGVDKLSSSFGLATLAMSVGLLPGPLICGEIQDATSKWDLAFILCGILTLLASIPPFLEPCAKRYVKAKEQRKVENTTRLHLDILKRDC